MDSYSIADASGVPYSVMVRGNAIDYKVYTSAGGYNDYSYDGSY